MMAKTHGLSRSVHTLLVQHARSLNVDANLVLTRYANERLLYRLSCSRYAERFVLKGALLMLVWLGETVRPTRDTDLLGFGDLSDTALASIFRDVCTVSVQPDGMTYLNDSVRVADIRLEDTYGGKRVTLRALLGSARLRVQVDVGLGDAVSPPPLWLDYPSLLDLPRPRLRAYRPETVIAEVALGTRNSRMRDFFDVYMLAKSAPLDGESLTGALRATFERRRTDIPAGLPLLTGFSSMSDKQVQWRAFLEKTGLTSAPGEFGEVIEGLSRFLQAPIDAARTGAPFAQAWKAGGPWIGTKPEAGDDADA